MFTDRRPAKCGQPNARPVSLQPHFTLTAPPTASTRRLVSARDSASWKVRARWAFLDLDVLPY